MSRDSVLHGIEASWRTIRTQGGRSLIGKIAGGVQDRFGGVRPLGLYSEDIALVSDARSLPRPSTARAVGAPLRIGWVSTPPALGSGGHTTAFRMVRALHAAGHAGILFLYDRWGGSMDRHRATIRHGWPDLQVEIRDARDGISGVDVAIATSWESAHVLAQRGRSPMHRLYFVQDYEPFFYPRGWEYSLAEDSYRFGFNCIALGGMVAELLKMELSVDAETVEFGSDTTEYGLLTSPKERAGIAFFGRPGFPRRGYLLGKSTVEHFHHIRPLQPIHVFGSDARDIEVPIIRHGNLRTRELNELYNSVIAGVVPSFTNVSLVPEEMLSAGAIPVCNDSKYSREVLKNPYVSWVDAHPKAMAAELAKLVDGIALAERAKAAAASVVGRSWTTSQESVVRIVEDAAYGSRRR